MEKVFDLNLYDRKRKVFLAKSSYRDNDTLAVLFIEVYPDGTEEEYGVFTVNLPQSDVLCHNGKSAFIDTNNWGNELLQWLVDNGICRDTSLTGQSGYCSYPLVVFTDEALASMRAL